MTPFAASPPGLRDEKGSRQTQSVRVDGGGIGTDRSLSTCVPSALPQPACLARCRRLIPDSLIIARRHLGSIRVALTARTTTVAADTTQCYPLRRRRPAARHNNRPTSACRTPSSRPEPVSPSVSSPVLSSSVVSMPLLNPPLAQPRCGSTFLLGQPFRRSGGFAPFRECEAT